MQELDATEHPQGFVLIGDAPAANPVAAAAAAGTDTAATEAAAAEDEAGPSTSSGLKRKAGEAGLAAEAPAAKRAAKEENGMIDLASDGDDAIELD